MSLSTNALTWGINNLYFIDFALRTIYIVEPFNFTESSRALLDTISLLENKGAILAILTDILSLHLECNIAETLLKIGLIGFQTEIPLIENLLITELKRIKRVSGKRESSETSQQHFHIADNWKFVRIAIN